MIKQNRGSIDEGIWIVRLKDEGRYCKNSDDRNAGKDDIFVLMEANHNHYGKHTVAEFIEVYTEGCSNYLGGWDFIGKGNIFEDGLKAGGLVINRRIPPGIDAGKDEMIVFLEGG